VTKLIDEGEVAQLLADYGPGQRREAILDISTATFDDWRDKIGNPSTRRGEGVLCIQRPDGKILLHTKRFYPLGIYRLPTGGVNPGETVLAGAARETKEETGLEISVERFLGTVEYEFRNRQRRFFYVSYVFVLRSDNSPPQVHDPNEAITDFRYVPPAEIPNIAAQLREISGHWGDWGRFRALPHEVVADGLGV
jgi:8-oxo-dGTP pyrophosphatase MutT (NUDIX family)